jgi:hypothetical protein
VIRRSAFNAQNWIDLLSAHALQKIRFEPERAKWKAFSFRSNRFFVTKTAVHFRRPDNAPARAESSDAVYDD